MTPLLLDVDTGIDDAFGLLYALAAPEARLSASRRSPATSASPRPTRNTRAVLALAGRADITVVRGRRPPLLGYVGDASDIHGDGGLGPRRAARAAARAGTAARRRRDDRGVAREHAGRLVLVATGPLTNIALAVARDPDLPRRLARFVVMGGAFDVRRQCRRRRRSSTSGTIPKRRAWCSAPSSRTAPRRRSSSAST